jgi:hypothetical protein
MDGIQTVALLKTLPRLCMPIVRAAPMRVNAQVQFFTLHSKAESRTEDGRRGGVLRRAVQRSVARESEVIRRKFSRLLVSKKSVRLAPHKK